MERKEKDEQDTEIRRKLKGNREEKFFSEMCLIVINFFPSGTKLNIDVCKHITQ
jgi:hypothetical protein